MGENYSFSGNSYFLKGVKADGVALSIFLVLFSIVYIGMVLKIVLPQKILDTPVILSYGSSNYIFNIDQSKKIDYKFNIKGEVAGVATASSQAQDTSQGLLNLLTKVASNFITNLLASLTF